MKKTFYVLTFQERIVTAVEGDEVETFSDEDVLDFSYNFKTKKEAVAVKNSYVDSSALKVNRVSINEV